MPIHATAPAAPPPPPVVTQDVVDEVMAQAKAHCAPSTWDKFARSMAANKFPFKVSL